MEKSVVEQLGLDFFNEKYKNTLVVLEGKLYFIHQATSAIIKPTKEITDMQEAEATKNQEWEAAVAELRALYDETGFDSYGDPDGVEDEDMDAWREFRDTAIEIDEKIHRRRLEAMELRRTLEEAKKDLKKEYSLTVFNFEANKQEKINAKLVTDWQCFWDFPLGFRAVPGQSFVMEKDTRGHRAYRLHNVYEETERTNLATKLRWWIENERWKHILNPTFPTVKEAVDKINTEGGWQPISLKARVQKFQNSPKRYVITVNGANIMLLDENARATNIRSNLYSLHKEDANLPEYENIAS